MISTFLTTLLIIDAVVLIFLVVVFQHGNEGGIGGSLGGGNSSGFFGATGGLKTIVQATWICGILFFALAMTTAWVRTHERYKLKGDVEKSLTATPTTETAAPVLPPVDVKTPAADAKTPPPTKEK